MIHKNRHNKLFKTIAMGLACLFLVNGTFQQTSFADIFYKITHDALSTGNIGDRQAPNAGDVDKAALAAQLLEKAGLLKGDENARQALIDFCLETLEGQAAMRILRESGIAPTKIVPIITRASDIRDQVARAGESGVDLGMSTDGGEESQIMKTPLHSWHIRHGAKMTEFARSSLPASYKSTGAQKEHLAVRTKAGLFDIGHMGVLEISGPEVLEFLKKVTTNQKISKLKRGKVLYSYISDEDGNIIDDIMVSKLEDDRYMLVVNAANKDKVKEWLAAPAGQTISAGVNIEDMKDSKREADRKTMMAIQGPNSLKVLQKLAGDNISEQLGKMKYFRFREIELKTASGPIKVIVSRTGYTGEKGYEIFVHPDQAEALWTALIDEGEEFGLVPCGLGARDSLRLEAGLPLHGHELAGNLGILPSEAGFGNFVSEDGNYIGKETLLRKQAESKRQVVNIVVVGDKEREVNLARGVPPVARKDEKFPASIVKAKTKDGEWVEIGKITSSAVKSPTWQKEDSIDTVRLAMACIGEEYAKPGTELKIETRGRTSYAVVLPRDFYDNAGDRFAREHMPNYIPITDEERAEMLEVIGVASEEELFKVIPPEAQSRGEIDLPSPMNRMELFMHMWQLSNKNTTASSATSFLGGGIYHSRVPEPVDAVSSDPAEYSPYTPYQAEISQGKLEEMYLFQSLICNLTGMEVANASLYDGASALAEAALMAYRYTDRHKIVIAGSLNPEHKKVLETYLENISLGKEKIPLEIVEVPVDPNTGEIDVKFLEEVIDEDTACVIAQQPNFLGVLETRLKDIADKAHNKGALFTVSANLLSLADMQPPSEYDADIVVSEAQILGNHMNLGGPGLGVIAIRTDSEKDPEKRALKKFMRQMPGRIAGKTVDAEGKVCYDLSLGAREQHIRREKATSNICSNQALVALRTAVYLMWMANDDGLKRASAHSHSMAVDAMYRIEDILGFRALFPGKIFNEFVLASAVPIDRLNELLLEKGIIGGLDVSQDVPMDGNFALFSFTDLTRSEDIEKLLVALQEISQEGNLAESAADWDSTLPSSPAKDASTKQDFASIPDERDISGLIPAIGKDEVVRYFASLAKKNYGIESGLQLAAALSAVIPLGSCTVKYNPIIDEIVAAFEGFTAVHPSQPEETIQGTLELMYNFERDLSKLCGFHQFTLQPAAGAHGELTGLQVMRAYHKDKGHPERNIILTPDSSHGTNPASAKMAGCKTKEIKTKPDGTGTIDLEALKVAIEANGGKIAGIMITNPNTLGLFEKDIIRICEMVHNAGGLVYMDGANLNAFIGREKLAEWGVDIVHINLHKTFGTPHGGGGPGAGPVGVTEELAKFLPGPTVEYNAAKGYYLNFDMPDSIGQIHANFGNVGVVIKAYAYLRALGLDGLKAVSRDAVINANYMMVRLKGYYSLPFSKDVPRMHEFVIKPTQKMVENVSKIAGKNVKLTDLTTHIAKALQDRGFHPPTVHFPLIVHGALMIEPTETATKEWMDNFCNAMIEIAEILESDDEEKIAAIINAPHTTPVRRVDATKATREPILASSDIGSILRESGFAGGITVASAGSVDLGMSTDGGEEDGELKKAIYTIGDDLPDNVLEAACEHLTRENIADLRNSLPDLRAKIYASLRRSSATHLLGDVTPMEALIRNKEIAESRSQNYEEVDRLLINVAWQIAEKISGNTGVTQVVRDTIESLKEAKRVGCRITHRDLHSVPGRIETLNIADIAAVIGKKRTIGAAKIDLSVDYSRGDEGILQIGQLNFKFNDAENSVTILSPEGSELLRIAGDASYEALSNIARSACEGLTVTLTLGAVTYSYVDGNNGQSEEFAYLTQVNRGIYRVDGTEINNWEERRKGFRNNIVTMARLAVMTARAINRGESPQSSDAPSVDEFFAKLDNPRQFFKDGTDLGMSTDGGEGETVPGGGARLSPVKERQIAERRLTLKFEIESYPFKGNDRRTAEDILDRLERGSLTLAAAIDNLRGLGLDEGVARDWVRRFYEGVALRKVQEILWSTPVIATAVERVTEDRIARLDIMGHLANLYLEAAKQGKKPTYAIGMKYILSGLGVTKVGEAESLIDAVCALSFAPTDGLDEFVAAGIDDDQLDKAVLATSLLKADQAFAGLSGEVVPVLIDLCTEKISDATALERLRPHISPGEAATLIVAATPIRRRVAQNALATELLGVPNGIFAELGMLTNSAGIKRVLIDLCVGEIDDDRALQLLTDYLDRDSNQAHLLISRVRSIRDAVTRQAGIRRLGDNVDLGMSRDGGEEETPVERLTKLGVKIEEVRSGARAVLDENKTAKRIKLAAEKLPGWCAELQQALGTKDLDLLAANEVDSVMPTLRDNAFKGLVEGTLRKADAADKLAKRYLTRIVRIADFAVAECNKRIESLEHLNEEQGAQFMEMIASMVRNSVPSDDNPDAKPLARLDVHDAVTKGLTQVNEDAEKMAEALAKIEELLLELDEGEEIPAQEVDGKYRVIVMDCSLNKTEATLLSKVLHPGEGTSAVDLGMSADGGEEVKTALVVEDDEAHADILKLTLERAGYKVAVVESAEEAIECLGSEQPTVVVTDLGLLGETRGGFRVLEAAGDTPKIVITGSAENLNEAEHTRLQKLGVGKVFGKPFDRRELVTTMDKLTASAESIQPGEDADGIDLGMTSYGGEEEAGKEAFIVSHDARFSGKIARLLKSKGYAIGFDTQGIGSALRQMKSPDYSPVIIADVDEVMDESGTITSEGKRLLNRAATIVIVNPEAKAASQTDLATLKHRLLGVGGARAVYDVSQLEDDGDGFVKHVEICAAVALHMPWRQSWAESYVDSVRVEAANLKKQGKRLGIVVDATIGSLGTYDRGDESFIAELRSMAEREGFENVDIFIVEGESHAAAQIEKYIDEYQGKVIVRGIVREVKSEERLPRIKAAEERPPLEELAQRPEVREKVRLVAVDDTKIPNTDPNNLHYFPVLPIIEYSITGKQVPIPCTSIRQGAENSIIMSVVGLQLPPTEPIDSGLLKQLLEEDAGFVNMA